MQVFEKDVNEAAVVLEVKKGIKIFKALGPFHLKWVLRLAEYPGRHSMKILKLLIHLVKPAGDDDVLRLQIFTEDNGGEFQM